MQKLIKCNHAEHNITKCPKHKRKQATNYTKATKNAIQQAYTNRGSNSL
jgi:hypothetical protein